MMLDSKTITKLLQDAQDCELKSGLSNPFEMVWPQLTQIGRNHNCCLQWSSWGLAAGRLSTDDSRSKPQQCLPTETDSLPIRLPHFDVVNSCKACWTAAETSPTCQTTSSCS